MQVEFGTGTLYAVPLASSQTPNVTPVPFGVSQDISVDISFTTKQLYGQNQFPVAIGRGEAKITGKCKHANFSAIMFNGIFVPGTVAAGSLQVSQYEAHSVPATGPYSVTITPPGSGTFVDDLGVQYSTTGANFTKVTSVTTAGQYSFAAGVYTFDVADEGVAVLISYSYTSATLGYSSTIANSPMGYAPTFLLVLSNTYQSNIFTLKLWNCLSSKLTMDFKNTDFSIPEMDFEAFANAAGQVYSLNVSAL